MRILIKKILRSSLFRSSGIYTLTSILNAIIPFLLIPVLTRNLSTADYGIVSMSAILINIISPFVGISANGAINRRYFDKNSDTFPRYVGNAFFLLAFSSILFLTLFFVFHSKISGYTALPSVWLFAILFIAIAQFVIMVLLTIWQAKIKPIKFGALQITQSVFNFGLTLFFILILNFSWQGRILGQLLATVLIAIIALIILIKSKYIKFEYNKEDIKDVLSFGLPLIPHTLGGLLIAFTDRILITNMISISETGVYTVAYQIGSVISLISSSFINAYVPWLYDKLNLDDQKIKVKIVKLTYLYFGVLMLGGILSIHMLPWFINFFAGKSFKSAGIYTFWIVLGYVFNGMYLMVAGFIFYVKKTGLLALITFSSAVLNIPLCYFLIKSHGTIGAAISMSIIYFISFILTWMLSSRVYKMPWLNFYKL